MSDNLRLTVKDFVFYERSVVLRMPFRFGIVTLREAPQLFVAATVEDTNGAGTAVGHAAEMLAPKWFDKNPALSNEDNFSQLRLATSLAAGRYLAAPATTCFGLFADNYADHLRAGAEHGLGPLVASFGQAILDRAVLDAVCRIRGLSFYDAVTNNLIGLRDHDIAVDLAGFDFDGFLSDLSPADRIHARHTVGLVDPLTRNPEPVGDGLPETLREVIERYGHHYFKLKVSGDAAQDIARLREIAGILDDSLDDYRISLDGNEQFADGTAFLDFYRALEGDAALETLFGRTLFIEQPIARDQALMADISDIAAKKPVIVDESDGELGVFPRAVELGYSGVSSKSCKGLYKAIINAARCHRLGAGYFLSGEDLTMQAGIAVQQDLALVNLLGVRHVERNGHHYVRGFAGVSAREQADFLAAHGDIYLQDGDVVRLRIESGQIRIGSLAAPGFASAALPDVDAMDRVTL